MSSRTDADMPLVLQMALLCRCWRGIDCYADRMLVCHQSCRWRHSSELLWYRKILELWCHPVVPCWRATILQGVECSNDSNTIRIEYHLFLHFLSNEEMKMYQMVIYIRELYNNLWYNIILFLYFTYESYDASFCSSICRCLFYSYGIHKWFIDLRSIVTKIKCDGNTILYKQNQTNIKYTVF